MSFTKESAVQRAKTDLAGRVSVLESEIEEVSVDDAAFPDMSLGAAVEGEMAAQMISSGWRIIFKVNGKNFEYRADKYQLRLCGFNGTNHMIKS